MHQNLYPEIVLAVAIFVVTMLIFMIMVIAAISSILLEHQAKVKPRATAKFRYNSVFTRVQNLLQTRKE